MRFVSSSSCSRCRFDFAWKSPRHRVVARDFIFELFFQVAPGQLQFVRLIVVCFVVGVGRWTVRHCFVAWSHF